jgi:hypothetical protein
MPSGGSLSALELFERLAQPLAAVQGVFAPSLMLTAAGAPDVIVGQSQNSS